MGIFEYDGAYRSELWGDVVNIQAALDRDFLQRVVARVKPGTDVKALAAALKNDKQLGSDVKSERAYFASQTSSSAACSSSWASS